MPTRSFLLRLLPALTVLFGAFLLATAADPSAVDEAEGSPDPGSPQTRVVSPRAGLTGSEVEPGHDVEGGPISEGEQLRLWTPLTEAEMNAVDPTFRRLVELIANGQADKRVMRQYWFLRWRLDPFDRPIPENWRREGLRVLRDEERARQAVADFLHRREERLSSGASGPQRGDPLEPPAGSISDAAERLRGGGRSENVDVPGGVSASGVWVPIGPFGIAGRMTGLDRPTGSPDTLYASAADGGVWRTRDRGATWETLSDFEATLSGGSVILDPTNPNIIYFGTGEGNAAGDNYPGIGVLKSTDRGLTWTESNEFSSTVRRLAIHESDPDRIYAAGNDGCYLSTDAGATFSLIDAPGLPMGPAASDVLLRPDNPDWIYCAVWGSTDGGIYRSTDQGASWTRLDNGLPAGGDGGRIALNVHRANPDIMIAGMDVASGTVYTSVDAGDNWTVPSGSGPGYCGGQCWYDNVVGIDPVNPDIMYAGGISAYRSTDGGANWSVMSSGVHVDHHFVFTPTDGEVILANDGGVYHSSNHGTNWVEWSLGMDTTQYYGICRHPSDDVWAFGGTQDNGSHRRRDSDGWSQVLGGDGGMCMSGPDGSEVIIGEFQNMNIQRSANDGESFSNANGGINPQEPHPWVGMLVIDPSDRNNMWTGTDRVYRSLDARATDWVRVSGPLYANLSVSALEVAPTNSEAVFVGFSGGGLFKTTNGLDSTVQWANKRGAAMPTRGVRRIRIHPDDENTVYVVFSGFGLGKIWKSTNGGDSWTDQTGDHPDVPINDLLIDADNPGTLLSATDLAVYRSDDDGTTWYGFSTGLPTAAAIEFTYSRDTGKLRVGTHGRSMWDWQPSSETPTAVPDGAAVPGAQMTVARIGETDMRVYWDVRSCTAVEYNLFYGDLDDVAARTYSGAECSLGTAGQADVPLPSTASGSAFFVIAASDGMGTEGPHGFDTAGDPVPANGIGFCGITNQDSLVTCP